jgi:hypothetical protein
MEAKGSYETSTPTYRTTPRHVPQKPIEQAINQWNSTGKPIVIDTYISTVLDKCTLGAFFMLRKAIISFVVSVSLSVRPKVTTRLPLDGFSSHLIFEYFSKICREISSFMNPYHANVENMVSS